jgi:SPP1 family phage portal protein
VDAEKVLKIWEAGATIRDAMATTKAYFDGKQRNPALEGMRLDGRPKTKVLTNWVKYVARMHTGFLTGYPATYTHRDGSDSEPLTDYRNFYDSENLGAADSEHFRNALLYGYSAEILSFDGLRVRVQTTWPWDWTFVADERLDIVQAIHRQFIPAWTMFNGEIQEKDGAIFRVFTDREIITFRTSPGAQISTGNAMVEGSTVDEAGSRLEQISRVPHYFGRPPVVVYRVTEDGQPFLQQDFLRQCDAYDVTRSSMIDDIKHNVDSLLMTKGMKFERLLEKDDDGVTILATLKEAGMFPLPEGADAEYLSNSVDVGKFQADLKETRYSLHMMGCVPDLESAIGGDSGTITNISGIALKLLFHLMDQASAEMEKHFRQGLRDRVSVWNVLEQKVKGVTLEDYTVTLKRNLPFNETELVQYLPNLRGVVAVEDQLRMLPFIDAPAQAYENLQRELSALPVAGENPMRGETA